MRLIDADELKKEIHMSYSDDLGILEKIEKRPTAYDLNKVMEQLKEEEWLSYADFDEYVNEVCLFLDAKYDDLFHRGLERAIEIVKAGGKE